MKRENKEEKAGVNLNTAKKSKMELKMMQVQRTAYYFGYKVTSSSMVEVAQKLEQLIGVIISIGECSRSWAWYLTSHLMF